MKVLVVAGARPNFVKVAPLIRAMRQVREIAPILINTGQHYSWSMAEQFIHELGLPSPDVNLEVGSGSHAVQTAEVMKRLEPVLEDRRPDIVLVVGDVNSTLAAALTAVKMAIPVAHVEAGLRSFDRSMPEEINRILTDAISDLLFVTEESGMDNLVKEGVPREKIHLVGNVMIDALQAFRPQWASSDILGRLGIPSSTPYAVLTLHRPSNVDDPATLKGLTDALCDLSHHLPIVFPVHPRVKAQLERHDSIFSSEPVSGNGALGRRIVCLEPLGYFDFIALVSRARLMLTDSGGIQEETTILGVPCLTLRENTERPVTVTHGTNRIIGIDPSRIMDEALRALDHPPMRNSPPPLWDGQAADRIMKVLLDWGRCRSAAEKVAYGEGE